MQVYSKAPDKSLAAFVSKVWVFEIPATGEPVVLPFFPDGFPGIIYQDAGERMTLGCKGKALSALFVYGQTVEPLELVVAGKCRMLIFQLYPEVPFYLFNVNARELNNNCAELVTDQDVLSTQLLARLSSAISADGQVLLLTKFLRQAVRRSAAQADDRIHVAIRAIIDHKGLISISRLRENLFMTERTFERKFSQEVGVAPKFFARIIQFRYSLAQMNEGHAPHLTDIVYENGFADHSHFIRSFKQFTGKTPRVFQRTSGLIKGRLHSTRSTPGFPS